MVENTLSLSALPRSTERGADAFARAASQPYPLVSSETTAIYPPAAALFAVVSLPGEFKDYLRLATDANASIARPTCKHGWTRMGCSEMPGPLLPRCKLGRFFQLPGSSEAVLRSPKFLQAG
jgi:hypothetical protein